MNCLSFGIRNHVQCCSFSRITGVHNKSLYVGHKESRAVFVQRQQIQQQYQRRQKSCVTVAGKGFGTPIRTKAKQDRKNTIEICDKLIEVFESQPQGEWRKLIVFSKKWDELAEHVFARLQVLKETMEIEGGNPDAVMRYSIMARELQSLHKIVQRHNKIVNKFKENDTFEWEGLTMLYRAELTPAFFEHLEALIWSRDQSKKKEDLEEKETYVQMFLKIKSFLQSYDQVSEDQAKMDNAAAQFDDLLKGVGTIQDADARIDELAKSGRLDAPMLLTMAKAYSGVKESPYTKDEVKDVMFHLYMKAKEAAAQQQPSDIRILKHILSIDDPKYRFEALEEAFKAPTAVPSSLSNMDRDTSMDYLFTTPDNLLSVVEMVLKVYEDSKGRSSLLGQTADVMSTDVIKRLQETRDYIKKYYM